MDKKYYILILAIFFTISFSRSMEFTSCKTYVRVEKNLEKGEEFCLLALEKEPDNSYIPYYMGRFIYRPQKRTEDAGKMFVNALNLQDTKQKKIKTVNMKIFTNGKLQITGIRNTNLDDAKFASNVIYNMILKDKEFKKYATRQPRSLKDIQITDTWARLKTMSMC